MTPEKRFCLIGHNLQGSLSPALMDAAYHGRFAYDLIDEESFETAFAQATEYDAFNVTAPFKEKAYNMAFEHDRNSSGAKACNIMIPVQRYGKRCYMSYNSDVDGVKGSLLESGLSQYVPEGHAALVVGTGGAAAAAYVAVVKEMNRLCTVAGRNLDKARALSFNYTGLSPITLDRKILKHIDIIVYTLPGSAPVPKGLPCEEAVVLEANYKDPQLADAPCRQYISGKLWLLHQAISGFKIMTGEEPDVDNMRKVLGL